MDLHVFRPAGTLIVLSVLFSPCRAEDTPAAGLEARLNAIEARMTELQNENAALRAELAKIDSSRIPVTVGGKEARLQIGGLVQFQGEFGDAGDARYSPDNNDRLLLRRVRLGVSGEFLEDFDFKVEAEYAGASIALTDGFINWHRHEAANLKFGQFKTPFGYEFLASDSKLASIERSFGTDALTLNRQVGVQASGEFLKHRLNYATGLFNGNGANSKTNDNDNFTYVGRIAGTPWEGRLFDTPAKWTVGANAFTSRDKSVGLRYLNLDSTPLTPAADNIFAGDRLGWGMDSQLRVGGLDVWTEYLRVNLQPDSALPSADFDADTWYLQVGYFVIPKVLQPVLKYETFDPNTSTKGDETDTWTLGLNYYLKGDDIKLMFNYTLSDTPTASDQRKLFLRLQTIF